MINPISRVTNGPFVSPEHFVLEAKEMLKKYQNEFEYLGDIQAKVAQFYSQYLRIKQQ